MADTHMEFDHDDPAGVEDFADAAAADAVYAEPVELDAPEAPAELEAPVELEALEAGDAQTPWHPDQPTAGIAGDQGDAAAAVDNGAALPPHMVADPNGTAPPPPAAGEGDGTATAPPPPPPGLDEQPRPAPGAFDPNTPIAQPIDILNPPPPEGSDLTPGENPPVAPPEPSGTDPGSVIPAGQPGADTNDEPVSIIDDEITLPPDGPPPDAGTPPQVFDYEGQLLSPGSIPADAAGSLLAGLAPDAGAELDRVLAGITTSSGEVEVSSLLEGLDDLGVRHTTGAEVGADSVTDLFSSAEHVECIGQIGDQTITLNLTTIEDNGTMVLVDPAGLEYEARAEDFDRVWRSAGAPVITGPPAVGAGPPAGPAGPGGPSAGPDAITDLPPPPLDAALASAEDGGISAPVLLGIGAAVLVPTAIGGGILARRLTRQSS